MAVEMIGGSRLEPLIATGLGRFADAELEREAPEWSTMRGARSGRMAWQFTQELAGRLGVRMGGK